MLARDIFLTTAAIFLLPLFVSSADAQVADCDALVASPFDRLRPAGNAGVSRYKIDAKTAVTACRKAMLEHPQDVRLQFELARALWAANSKSDLFEAGQLYEEAAKAGFAPAFGGYGLCIENACRGGMKNRREANVWYRKGAEAGDPEAMKFLALNLLNGRGTAEDFSEAAKWYRKAAQGGDEDAQYMMRGWVISKEREATALREAAEAGDREAMREYARHLRIGLGVTRDEAAANEWLKKAAAP
jgi:TPR repeat protein